MKTKVTKRNAAAKLGKTRQNLHPHRQTKTTKFLEHRAPKLIENPKAALIVKGKKTSDLINTALAELSAFKKPNVVKLSQHNDILPFEDETRIEFFSRKRNCSQFLFGSHGKKRPHNLIFGRLFDGHLLDMIELGMERFKSCSEFASPKTQEGYKPCIAFIGPEFENDQSFVLLKNILMDYFQGEPIQSLNLAGIKHAIVCTSVAQKKIQFRCYNIHLKSSGTKIPKTKLEEVGPSVDFVLRRSRQSSRDLWETATKRPKEQKKVKNVSSNLFGEKLGKVHAGIQDLGSMQVKKAKPLRAAKGKIAR